MRAAPWSIYMLMAFIALASLLGACMTLLGSETSSIAWALGLYGLLILAAGAPVAAAVHQPRYHAAALVFSTALTVIWLGLLVLLLRIEVAWLGSERVVYTLLVFLLGGLPATAALACRSKPWGKVFSFTFAGITAVTALAALAAVWFAPGSGEEVVWKRILASAAWTYLGAGIGSVVLINIGRDKRYFRWVGLAAGLMTVVAGFAVAWRDDAGRGWWLTLEIAGFITITLAFVNLLLMTRHAGLVRWTQIAAITLTCLTGVLAVAVVSVGYLHPDGEGAEFWIDLLNKGLAAGFILAIGAILCLIAARGALRVLDRPVRHEVAGVKLECPNCGLSQVAGLDSACPKCLLKFRIVVSEPHCPACRHLLLNLTSDRCPECGTGITRPAAVVAAVT